MIGYRSFGSPRRAARNAASLKHRVFFVCVTVYVFLVSGCSHPSDRDLESGFYKNERSFNELLRMFTAEKQFSQITPTLTLPNYPEGDPSSLPHDRWERYRHLFKTCRVRGITRRTDSTVLFTASVGGLLTKGSYKGIAYCPVVPPKTYSQIDVPSDESFQDCNPHFRKLHDGWYLYLIECL